MSHLVMLQFYIIFGSLLVISMLSLGVMRKHGLLIFMSHVMSFVISLRLLISLN